jgi:hypothetical protein
MGEVCLRVSLVLVDILKLGSHQRVAFTIIWRHRKTRIRSRDSPCEWPKPVVPMGLHRNISRARLPRHHTLTRVTNQGTTSWGRREAWEAVRVAGKLCTPQKTRHVACLRPAAVTTVIGSATVSHEGCNSGAKACSALPRVQWSRTLTL